MAFAITGAFIALDFVTGIVKAFKEKDFNSSVMREGLFHKCAFILYVVFGVLVDYAQSYLDLGVTFPFATTICIYIVLTECGSIAENLGSINPAIVPDTIKSHFTKLNKK